ncbi:14455_t:CDS:10 [Entrophospora sp. SA101]|nr:14455_t:CDS:10 [Entrophospora sp. SA101]
MVNFSKPIADGPISGIDKYTLNVPYKNRLAKVTVRPTPQETFKEHKKLFKYVAGGHQKVGVNRQFFRQLQAIIKIIIPKIRSKELSILFLHSLFLVLRTWLSIVVAKLDGRIVRDLVAENDIARFCDTLSSLYSNLGKPLLDMIIFNYQLSKSIGVTGMSGLFGMYIATAWILRKVSPSFGKLAAHEAKLEGDFRIAHNRIITNAEEIAFYNGAQLEHKILNRTYLKLIKHINSIFKIRIFYNMFEDFVIKYSWSAFGLLTIAVPVFFPAWGGRGGKTELEGVSSNGKERDRTKAYITNKRLMLTLADAGGRLMYSYKELAELAGFTSRVYSLLSVLHSLYANEYIGSENQETYSLDNIQGKITYDHEGLDFQDVPIVIPGNKKGGEELVKDLNFSIKPGQHLLITGPNGVGKTSISRVIATLWPIFRGTLSRPNVGDIFYIPQKPYLSIGTLRDQIIYPHSYADMLQAKRTDDELVEILNAVHLSLIPGREGGWETKKEWKDVFSGGEKQRVSIARLFYHKPKFAILDECKHAVSSDVEGLMYQHAKDIGITLITISHRPSLFKYHSHLLKLSGEKGTWTFTTIGTPEERMSLDKEVAALENKLKDVEKIKERIDEINKELQLSTAKDKTAAPKSQVELKPTRSSARIQNIKVVGANKGNKVINGIDNINIKDMGSNFNQDSSENESGDMEVLDNNNTGTENSNDDSGKKKRGRKPKNPSSENDNKSDESINADKKLTYDGDESDIPDESNTKNATIDETGTNIQKKPIDATTSSPNTKSAKGEKKTINDDIGKADENNKDNFKIFEVEVEMESSAKTIEKVKSTKGRKKKVVNNDGDKSVDVNNTNESKVPGSEIETQNESSDTANVAIKTKATKGRKKKVVDEGDKADKIDINELNGANTEVKAPNKPSDIDSVASTNTSTKIKSTRGRKKKVVDDIGDNNDSDKAVQVNTSESNAATDVNMEVQIESSNATTNNNNTDDTVKTAKRKGSSDDDEEKSQESVATKSKRGRKKAKVDTDEPKDEPSKSDLNIEANPQKENNNNKTASSGNTVTSSNKGRKRKLADVDEEKEKKTSEPSNRRGRKITEKQITVLESSDVTSITTN